MKQSLHRILLFAIGGLLLIGCKATSPSSAVSVAAKPPLRRAVAPSSLLGTGVEQLAIDERDLVSSNAPFSSGNSESLARFAAGMSYALSDKSDLALEQFYQSALADPTNEPLVLEISRSLLSKKQAQKAIEVLSKSARRPEASAPVLIWLAQANLQAGQTNRAISASQSALAKAPDLLEGYQSLFGIFLTAGRPVEARNVLDQAVRHIKGGPDSLIDLAEMHGLYLKAHPEEPKPLRVQALKLLDQAAASKPFPDGLYLRLAQAYEHIGEPLRSAQIYLKLLGADTKPSARRDALREKLANIYLQAHDKKRAAEQLQAIVRDNPTHYPQAWYLLGQFATEARQLADAAHDFEQALLLDSGMEQAYYELALVQIDQRNVGGALETLDKARAKFPNTFVGEFFTGLAYSRLKSYEEAMKHFTAAEVIAQATEPKRLSQQFYFQLGAASERNHQIKQAEDYFQKCLQIAPDFDEAMNYLGFMWADRGENLARARELIEKAVKNEPKNAAYLDSLGWVFFKLNQPREALPWLLKAQEFSEEPDATLLDHLGDVYLALHQPGKAREAWKKSLDLESNEAVKKKLDLLPGAGS